MTTEVIAAAIAIAFLASACQSVTGFGFAPVMTPLLALAWGVKPAVATSMVLGTINLLPLLFEVRGSVSIPRVSWLLLGFVVGVPSGVFLLERLDDDTLKAIVAGTVIVASLLLYVSPRLGGDEDTLAGRLIAGALSGSIGSSTSLSAPPVVLYLLGRRLDMSSFRATTLVFFLPSNVVIVLALALVGRITGDVLLLSAAALPSLALGVACGAWLRRRVQAERFRTVVLAVLLATGVAVLASAAGGLA
ncbi:MAG TPA: sulfite exporter TauE/SafE family protein [Dehalococcoidia bacterium]|nr:sulfite exporter TauE/SafE family protein [Dehalococcoidia bacterium]